MTQREVFLLRILGVVAGLAILGLAILGLSASSARLQSDIGRMRKQLQALQTRTAEADSQQNSPHTVQGLEQEKAEMQKRFYAKDSVSVYTFAESVKRSLADKHLTTEQLTIDAKKHEIGLQVQGSLVGLLQFLQAIQDSERYIAINSLIIQRIQAGQVKATIRVMYVESPL